MDDLISRQAVLKELPHALWGKEWDEALAKAIIESMPTIDAVPVVRCKGCEFYTEKERWCRRLGLCGAFDQNGYCSHAERKEE